MDVRRVKVAALGMGIGLATGIAVPASAPAAGLIAAYDRYEPGKGFEIGLANLSTGGELTLPAGVNTADDELHPGLSADGRYLLWVRMRLLPKLNGDIVPPAERTLFMLDRQTGAITSLNTGDGAPAGPSFFNRPTRAVVWGVRTQTGNGAVVKFQAVSADNTISGSTGFVIGFAPPPGQLLDFPHAAMDQNTTTTHVLASWVTSDANTGAQASAGTILREGPNSRADFGDAASPVTHPVSRHGDGYVALDKTTGSDADIHTISFPGETALTLAPTPITTAEPERMPAWSPGGLQLGFVRTTAGRRVLPVYDLTPGLQAILNPPVALGADAPTPQTRAFQSSWGGISIAESSALDVPVVTCDPACQRALRSSLSTKLTPTLSTTSKGQTVGIFVARVTGKRKLLGRTVPRIKPVGRVPLGKTRKGRNRFRWNRKVDGRRLKRGTYLLTYRALRRKRIVSTSGSIRFKVTKAGRIRGVKRQR
jgi:hypothetical protein